MNESLSTLMKPNWVSISGDEFVDWDAVDLRRSWNAFLLSIDEDRHGILLPIFRTCLVGGCRHEPP